MHVNSDKHRKALRYIQYVVKHLWNTTKIVCLLEYCWYLFILHDSTLSWKQMQNYSSTYHLYDLLQSSLYKPKKSKAVNLPQWQKGPSLETWINSYWISLCESHIQLPTSWSRWLLPGLQCGGKVLWTGNKAEIHNTDQWLLVKQRTTFITNVWEITHSVRIRAFPECVTVIIDCHLGQKNHVCVCTVLRGW